MKIQLTAEKLFSDLPAAHRQHTHNGHCALIHGHNWSFHLVFACNELDKDGFVVDFGDLGWVKKWFVERFDHTLLLNDADPKLDYLKSVLTEKADEHGQTIWANIVQVPNCACEGLAKFVLEEINRAIDFMPEHHKRGLRLIRLTVHEDSKNSATAELPRHLHPHI